MKVNAPLFEIVDCPTINIRSGITSNRRSIDDLTECELCGMVMFKKYGELHSDDDCNECLVDQIMYG